MVSDRDSKGSVAAYFGRIDPFCWLVVVPLVLVAALGVVIGETLIWAPMLAGAVVVLLFDSWSNRPLSWRSSRPDPYDDDLEPMEPPRRAPEPRREPQQRRPAQAPSRPAQRDYGRQRAGGRSR